MTIWFHLLHHPMKPMNCWLRKYFCPMRKHSPCWTGGLLWEKPKPPVSTSWIPVVLLQIVKAPEVRSWTVNLSTKLSSRKGNVRSYQVLVSLWLVEVVFWFQISGALLNLWGAERPCPDGPSKWRFAQEQDLKGLWMMDIAGENMAKRIFSELSFQG